jgi:hypothetical protein
VVDPERRVLPKLAFAQAYVHVRGRTPFTASLLFGARVGVNRVKVIVKSERVWPKA